MCYFYKMSLIVPNLIVGSFEESFDRSILKQYTVTHILNVATECEVSDRVDLVYAKYAIEDDCPDESADITKIMDDCMRFIKNAHDVGGCVFVHCLEGKSRSVCVVLAYMCKHLMWNWNDAYLHMERNRPQMDIYMKYFYATKLWLSL